MYHLQLFSSLQSVGVAPLWYIFNFYCKSFFKFSSGKITDTLTRNLVALKAAWFMSWRMARDSYSNTCVIPLEGFFLFVFYRAVNKPEQMSIPSNKDRVDNSLLFPRGSFPRGHLSWGDWICRCRSLNLGTGTNAVELDKSQYSTKYLVPFS